jgi:aminopeptidase N
MARYLLVFVFLIRLVTLNAQDEEDVYNKGLVQYTLQDYIGAIETFDSMLVKFPKNAKAKYYRLVSKYMLGDFPGAKADYLKMKGELPSGASRGLRILDDKFILKELKENFYEDDKLYPELGYRPKYTHKDTLRGALRPERTCFDVTFYNLSLKIDPKKKVISGSNDITFRVVQPTQKIQIDLYDIYKIGSIEWNKKTLPYIRDCNALFISFPEKLMPGTMQTITIRYSGKPRSAPKPPWNGGFVWKTDSKKNYWDGVACEHLGASSWWPTKDHLSDEPDSMQMTFTVPDGYDLISNGTPRSKTPAGNGYTSHTWFVSYPINNYDATFYLGKFSHFSDTVVNKEGKYPLDYYVLPQNLDKAKVVFAQTKNVLKVYEQLFGEYPFMRDGFALVEAPFAGMEHQGAIAYGSGYDDSKKNFMYHNKKEDPIIVHETAHEWWGNSLTVNDMNDIWIQEGFATYSELLYFEKMYGYTEYIKEMAGFANYIFNFWPVIDHYNVNENGFASNDCYMKGATILQCLRSTMNSDSLFFKLIKDFALRYKYKTINSSDFEHMVNEYTGQDYSAFFNKYLRDKNLPILAYTYKKEGSSIEFTYRWAEVEKSFHMPFCITDGNKNYRLEGTTDVQKITLKNAKTVRFYSPIVQPEKSDKNSLTYFWTRRE